MNVIGVGMLGYGFMGRAHALAYRTIPHLPSAPSLVPRLVSVCGRDQTAVADAAKQLGFAESTDEWRDLIASDRVGIFDNSGPNNAHAEPTIGAARAGKHVFCEKPLGRDAEESLRMWAAAAEAGVHHMCGFNYRFVPAMRLAREILEAGDLGEIVHFRARYLQDWIADPNFAMVWRLDRSIAGSGALADLGAHVFDLARYLVGEPSVVTGTVSTFVSERPGGSVDVDDAVAATIEFECGAIGAVEASRVCPGRRNALTLEINGSRGSIAFDLERLNELRVYTGDPASKLCDGFRTVLVTEPDHSLLSNWWPPGHALGWEHTFTNEFSHFLDAIVSDQSVGPHGADFEDGYRAAEICDAVLRSARSGRREEIAYRDLVAIGG